MTLFKNRLSILCFTLLCCMMLPLACSKACGPSKRVFFIEPQDNATVPENFKVVFGVENMTVKPAGIDMEDKNSGHFHIVIDEAADFTPEGVVVGEDATHIHYGKGQTEAMLQLSPGKHKLTLQFADGAHRSYGKSLATSIRVNVLAGAPEAQAD